MRLIATEDDPVASGRSPESHFSSRDGASFGMRDACFLLFISAASALSNLFEPNTSFRQGTTPTPTQNNWFSCQLYQDGCRLACPCMTLVSDGLRRIWDSLHPPIAHVPVILGPPPGRMPGGGPIHYGEHPILLERCVYVVAPTHFSGVVLPHCCHCM